MTDKQIIIDGVDVSGCEYIIPPHKQCPNKPMLYAKETSCFACKEHNTKLNFCKNNPNCYYKQRKRAEKTVEECHKYQAELEDKLISKEQECEELKEEIINRNEKIEELRFSVSDLTNRLCDLNAEKSFRIVDLEQTLTEIKEIAEKNLNIHTCAFKGCGYDLITKQILQKISEVVDET